MRGCAHLLLALTSLAACSPGDSDEQARRGPTSADSAEYAASIMDAEGFDTVTWESPLEAVERGKVVFEFSCRKCHGEGGAGDGGFVTAGDTLTPPSFLGEGWRFADDRESLRVEVFTGTGNEGMPHWGLEGLKYRDIDAVSAYILGGLRDQN